MIGFLMRTSAFLICLALAACGPRVPSMIQGDPTATAALLAMPDAQFFAQTRLAQQISDRCSSIGFNQRFNAALINQRTGGSQQAAAVVNSRSVDLEFDVATRSLQARYDIELTQADLCDVGAAEVARQSALSAVLVPF